MTRFAPLVALFATPLLMAAAPAPAVTIGDPWVREAPPGATAMAGYLAISNTGAGALTLVGATSPQFREVQMHEVVEENGMAHMVQVQKLGVPGKGKLAFVPGSTHLMLIGPKKPLKGHDPIQLTLLWEGGAKTRVLTSVRPRKPAENAGHEHQH